MCAVSNFSMSQMYAVCRANFGIVLAAPHITELMFAKQ